MKPVFLIIALFFTGIWIAPHDKRIPVPTCCDDIGICHSVNIAAEEVLKKEFPVSMSVMVACQWFTEAAEMLKKYPNVSIGIHLTLNSEWKQIPMGICFRCKRCSVFS